jgi:hypothetical protein
LGYFELLPVIRSGVSPFAIPQVSDFGEPLQIIKAKCRKLFDNLARKGECGSEA